MGFGRRSPAESPSMIETKGVRRSMIVQRPNDGQRSRASANWPRRLVVAALLLALGAVAGFVAADARQEYAAGKLQKAFALGPAAAASIRFSDNWATAERRLLLVGDSRVAQWRPAPKAPGLGVAIAGVGGETSSEMLARWRAQTVSPTPDVVLFAVGVNDMVAGGLNPAWADRILANYLNNLQATVASAKSAGADVAVLSILRPATPGFVRKFGAWSDKITELTAAANAGLAEQLNGASGAALIDANAVFPGPGPLPAEFAVDALHINAAAYELLNAAVLDRTKLR